MRISDWSSDVCSSDLIRATIQLQQIDRPLLAEQRALLNEPKPRAPRIARDFQHIADPLHGPSVNELLERERMFARARQKRDDFASLLPVVQGRSGDTLFMQHG